MRGPSCRLGDSFISLSAMGNKGLQVLEPLLGDAAFPGRMLDQRCRAPHYCCLIITSTPASSPFLPLQGSQGSSIPILSASFRLTTSLQLCLFPQRRSCHLQSSYCLLGAVLSPLDPMVRIINRLSQKRSPEKGQVSR